MVRRLYWLILHVVEGHGQPEGLQGVNSRRSERRLQQYHWHYSIRSWWRTASPVAYTGFYRDGGLAMRVPGAVVPFSNRTHWQLRVVLDRQLANSRPSPTLSSRPLSLINSSYISSTPTTEPSPESSSTSEMDCDVSSPS